MSEVLKLYWHCLSCGDHDPVEPTGGDDAYTLGDHEPCITCGDGTAHVMTMKMAAAYEQGRALGFSAREAWERALRVGARQVEAVRASGESCPAHQSGSCEYQMEGRDDG